MNATRHAEIYGVSTVNISRWKSAGLRAGFPCPLDTPENMPEWWANMQQVGVFQKSCPTKILVAAGKTQAVINSFASGGGGESETDLSGLGGEEMNYSLSIEVAKTNILAIKTLMDAAVRADNETKVVALQRPLNDAVTTLRELERDRGKIQAAAGETLPKEEVRSAMLELHANIQKQFRQGIKSAFVEIADVAATREAWSVFADGLVDRICLKLTESDFAAPIETP